jgi:hypothetical protein
MIGAASLLGLGLLPRGSMILFGGVALALLAVLGQRQCTVMQLRDQVSKQAKAVETAQAGRAKAEALTAQAELREAACLDANAKLADSARRQTDAIDAWAAAASAAQERAQAALREATRSATDDRSKAAWLADLLARARTDGDTCTAAVARVRDALRAAPETLK